MIKKRGVSAIVGTVILIAIVVATGAIVWGVINSTVGDSLSSSSCSNLMGKIDFNRGHTCFENGNLTFSVNIGDVEIDGVLISVSGGGSTKSIKFMNGTGGISGLYYYSGGLATSLPGKNEGKAYIWDLPNDFSSEVDLLEISPIVDGKQCNALDSISEIPPCYSLGI
jgi:flagellin-like protein